MKQKTEDYKTSVVKYYLNNNQSMEDVCKVFDCKKPSSQNQNLLQVSKG